MKPAPCQLIFIQLHKLYIEQTEAAEGLKNNHLLQESLCTGHLSLTLIRMAIQKCIAMWLGVIYDFQATNRKQGRLCENPHPLWQLPLVGWESYMTSSWPALTKIPPETGGFSYFLTEKAPKTLLFKKTLNKI